MCAHVRNALTPLKRIGSPRRNSPIHPIISTVANELPSTPLCHHRQALGRRIGRFLNVDEASNSTRSSLPCSGKLTIRGIPNEKFNNYETTYTIPSLNTPDRCQFLEKGLDQKRSWNILGQGTFGIVLEALYRGNAVAAKLMCKRRHLSSQAALENEANGFGLNHPNIIKIIKVIDEHKDFGIVLMEKCNGSELQKLIDDPLFVITEERKIRYSLDIANALRHCHKNNVLHLDLKPKNVLVCAETDSCKLFDFGSSLNKNNQSNESNIMSTIIYLAPELMKGQKATEAADIYAFGITMWQIDKREVPYSMCETVQEVILKVGSGLRPNLKNANNYSSLYKNCWNESPLHRLSLELIIARLSEMAAAIASKRNVVIHLKEMR